MKAGADAIDCIEPRGKNPGYLIREYSCLGLLEPRKSCPHVFDDMEDASTGGIRRGTDMSKASYLVAIAVGIGCGGLYALSCG